MQDTIQGNARSTDFILQERYTSILEALSWLDHRPHKFHLSSIKGKMVILFTPQSYSTGNLAF